jgi:oligosaccharide repeat unit polymerase
MIALFACLIIGHQLTLLLVRRRFDSFDVLTLIDVVLLTMWVYAPLVDDSLRFALDNDPVFSFTTLLGIGFLYAGLHFPMGKKTASTRRWSEASLLRMRWLVWALILFCGATLLVVYQQAQLSGAGIWGYLTGERLFSYRVFLNEQNEGSIPGAIIQFTRPILLLWLAIALERRQWRQSVFLYVIILAGIIMISTTRLQIIITLLIPLFYYHRVHGYHVSIPISILAAVIFVIFLYTLNIWRGQGLESLRNVDFSLRTALDALPTVFNPMRGYEMLWRLERGNQLPYEYGLSYLYVPLTAIPRALWHNKPLVSHEARWTTYLFGQHFAMVSEGWGVWTFTVWGEGLTQFGILGVFINLFLYGLLVNWARHRFSQSPHFSIVWFYYSIFAATYLRSSFSALAWTFLVSFVPLGYVYSRWVQEQKSFVAGHNRHFRGTSLDEAVSQIRSR